MESNPQEDTRRTPASLAASEYSCRIFSMNYNYNHEREEGRQRDGEMESCFELT